eukprot:1693470-Alexandrium_andersonii.AAC.1
MLREGRRTAHLDWDTALGTDSLRGSLMRCEGLRPPGTQHANAAFWNAARQAHLGTQVSPRTRTPRNFSTQSTRSPGTRPHPRAQHARVRERACPSRGARHAVGTQCDT